MTISADAGWVAACSDAKGTLAWIKFSLIEKMRAPNPHSTNRSLGRGLQTETETETETCKL